MNGSMNDLKEEKGTREELRRSLAGPTVPPGGLYMTRLWYEDERLNE